MSSKILLIEDDKTVRENTAELLELSQYKVETASNGKIGIEKAPVFMPDIIVCDIMMPEMDGYQVLENLSKDNALKKIPFIFLSAKTDHKDVRKGMNLGADDYLTKPFEEEELIDAIESRLAKADIINSSENNQVSSLNLQSFEALKEVFRKERIKTFEAGELIFESGQASNSIYLIDKGVVKTYKLEENGKELITAIHKVNDIFGDISFTKQNSVSEFASALENTSVFEISTEKVKTIFNQHPQVMFEFIDQLGDHLSETKTQLMDMAYSSVRKKTAQSILLFSERLKKNKLSQIRISRADLAAVAGIASESLIRTLSTFKKEGIIDVEGRNIKINDFEALERIV
ncbi:response regulator [Psychroflexus sediminis]|uniref:cAMP-binding domain of CRP or a regulatory subunit of cAMP-dependent protein kinases n=1 Tax=Psychroflexus sediminis TaxID=470826 RepID=A0A1G7VVH4_9FLAO|nr:response regulator [Psychroflexus sediminis]SDG63796.1 cAMP-binding domain of CRP or a regulatory subunit of cAMP-dependent protein kinases [Psychroflexus sediminis]